MKNIEKMIAQKYFELEMFIYLLRLKKKSRSSPPYIALCVYMYRAQGDFSKSLFSEVFYFCYTSVQSDH